MKISDLKEVKEIFVNYAYDYKFTIFFIFLIQISASFFVTLQPMILAGAVDTITNNFQIQDVIYEEKEDSSIGSFFNLNQVGTQVREITNRFFLSNRESPLTSIAILLFFYLTTVVISSFIQFAGTMLGLWVRFSTSVVIRDKLMNKVFKLSLPFVNKSKTGEIISRFVTDAENTAQGLGPVVSATFLNLTLLIIYGIFLFSTSFVLTLTAIALFLIQFLIISLLRDPIRRRESRVYDTKASLTSSIQEIFINLRYIKIFNAELFQKKIFKDKLNNIKKSEFSSALLRHSLDPVKIILENLALVGIVIAVSYFILNNLITVTAGVVYIVVGRLILPPINNFSVLFIWLQGVLAANERVKEIMHENISIKNGDRKIDSLEKIKFKGVSFSYNNDKKILKNINLNIHKGEKVAIVGPSGAGKSTLLDLLIRFYDPNEGCIEINGINLKELDVSSFRALFGVVSQETILFNDTIENNIRLGRHDISKEDLNTACDLSNATEFIKKLPHKLGTLAGDRGVRLSGGQKQRISIARALLGKPSVIIFDEATSNLDSQSEYLVQTGVDNALENITGIIIAHRLSTIKNSDKIIFLNNGKVDAIGSHEDLLKSSKNYRLMYDHQISKN